MSKMPHLLSIRPRFFCAALICCALFLPPAPVRAQTPAAKPATKPATKPAAKQAAKQAAKKQTKPRAENDSSAAQKKQPAPPQGCDLYRIMAARAVPSRERTFALRALKACPPGADTARLLERAVLSDDFAARAAALDSLETHLDQASIPFLVNLYDPSPAADLDPESRIRVFEYLSRLAEPAGQDSPAGGDNQANPGRRVPDRILIQGLYHPEARIRQAALRGLGRLDESRHWPLIQATLLHPRSPGERIAALQAARQMRGRDSLQALAAARLALGLPALTGTPTAEVSTGDRPDPGLERAAIELLGDLPGPRALESLLLYRVRRSGGANQALLQKTISGRLDPKKNHGYAIAPARLYAAATERSEIRAAVAAHTILYIEESTGLGYRLPPDRQRAQPEANWLRVRTTDGLTGWVHASRIQRIAPADP